jgi:hypothetical protein
VGSDWFLIAAAEGNKDLSPISRRAKKSPVEYRIPRCLVMPLEAERNLPFSPASYSADPVCLFLARMYPQQAPTGRVVQSLDSRITILGLAA